MQPMPVDWRCCAADEHFGVVAVPDAAAPRAQARAMSAITAVLEQPRLSAPPGACDCHMHVFDDRIGGLIPGAAVPPADSTAEDYRAVQQQLGLQRVVVVQANGHGFDNRVMLDALSRLGGGARGVAVVAPDVEDAELQRLTELGVRGVRLHLLPGGALGWHDLEAIAARVSPFGWHLQLQFDGWSLPEQFGRLRRLPVDLVIDHIGKFLGQGPPRPDDSAFKSLLGLLDGGRCWIKLSAPYESSRSGAPAYDDVARLARTLAASHVERCLWASNWPHPGRVPQPSSAAMLDHLLTWTDDEKGIRRILVDNPASLYGFAAVPDDAAASADVSKD